MSRSLLAFACLTGICATAAQAQMAPPDPADFEIVIQGDLGETPLAERPQGAGGVPGPVYHSQEYRITIRSVRDFIAQVDYNNSLRTPSLLLYEGEYVPGGGEANDLVAHDNWDGSPYQDLYPDITGADLCGGFAKGCPPDGGEYTLFVTTRDAGVSGTYLLLLDGAVVGWGATEELDELLSHGAMASGLQARALADGIAKALERRPRANGPTVSSKSVGEAAPALRPWLDISVTEARGDARSYTLPNLQFGADARAENGTVYGLAFNLGTLSAISPGSELGGTTRAVQPYAGFSLGDGTRVTASLIYGRTEYDETLSGGATGTADGTTVALTLEAEKDFPAARDLTGVLEASYGRQEIDGASGTLAAVSGESFRFGDISVGGRYGIGNGQAVTASLDYRWNDAPTSLAAGDFDATGLSGSVGFEFDAPGARFGVELSGIGASMVEMSAGATLEISF